MGQDVPDTDWTEAVTAAMIYCGVQAAGSFSQTIRQAPELGHHVDILRSVLSRLVTVLDHTGEGGVLRDQFDLLRQRIF